MGFPSLCKLLRASSIQIREGENCKTCRTQLAPTSHPITYTMAVTYTAILPPPTVFGKRFWHTRLFPFHTSNTLSPIIYRDEKTVSHQPKSTHLHHLPAIQPIGMVNLQVRMRSCISTETRYFGEAQITIEWPGSAATAEECTTPLPDYQNKYWHGWVTWQPVH